LSARTQRLERAGAMLESLSYARVLERGYAVVRRADDGAVVADATSIQAGDAIDIEFRDAARRRALVASNDAPGPRTPRKATPAKPKAPSTDQQDLF